MKLALTYKEVENKIIDLRGQQIILDSDVAKLYGVSTKEINQAVKNNPDKFPLDYIFSISKNEKMELVKNFDQFKTLKHSTVHPKAFTEKGLYMLATILKSEPATQTTLSIIETFARLKNIQKNIKELSKIDDKDKKQQLLKKSGEMIA